jgi:hypothetical protein
MKKIFSLAALTAFASSSFAAFTSVYSSGALGGNDTIVWSQFGPEGTLVASGATGTTTGGLGFTVHSVNDVTGADDGGELYVFKQGSSWNGEFADDEYVLYHVNSYDSTTNFSSLRIRFDSAVMGAGAQQHSNKFGDFNANSGYWNGAYGGGGTNVGFTAAPGTNDGVPANGNTYVGGLSDASDITEVFFIPIMADGSDNLGFAVGTVDIKVVPEPATMATLGLGAAALLRRRRK